MMQTRLGHLVFGVRPANLAFYRDLLAFLGWQTLYDSEEMLGVGDSHQISLWFGTAVKPVDNDYDGPGVNHVAISTTTQSDVDQAAEYLQERGIAMLFETPRHRPEFSGSDDQTYYQIMFESPDRILFEIVYTGAKEA
jgi:catechol 2,3-dioxygenase-like lactoylglutathione lyase family enzyme